jgi:hypothetical protein
MILQYLIIHCTATREGQPISSVQIKKMHTSPPPQGRGWKQVGYRDMIHLDGFVENLVRYDNDQVVDSWEITNGAIGLNAISAHIVYVGGLSAKDKPKDTRTAQQLESMMDYVFNIITLYPDILIAGHNQFDAKACPSFNVGEWCRSIGIPEKNISKHTFKPGQKAGIQKII